MSTPLIENCTFHRNTAATDGGALSCINAAPKCINCTFVDNVAGRWGGALYVDFQPRIRLINSIIAFNTQGEGGSLWIREYFQSDFRIKCCDIYGNAGGDWIHPYEGYYGYLGNIASDPCFCNQEGPALTLEEGSPCLTDSCGTMGGWSVGCE